MDRWEIDKYLRKSRGHGGRLHPVRYGRGRPRSTIPIRERSSSSSPESKAADNRSESDSSSKFGDEIEKLLKNVIFIFMFHFN